VSGPENVAPVQVAHFNHADNATALREIAAWVERTGFAVIAVVNLADDECTWQVVVDPASGDRRALDDTEAETA